MASFLCLCLLVVVVGASATVALDELLSARCQSKCLYDLEQSTKDNQRKRQLKHRIINLCREDANCSSCAAPCREPFDNVDTCRQQSCQQVDSPETCERSCAFLHRIYTEKPGLCPKPKLLSSDECVASCRRDGDCEETMKCCSNGCGQSCVRPRRQDSRLLPVATGVTISERKRGRSAVVRWVMSRLKPEHTDTWSNLYVVQWKWGVVKDETRMTRWQTITVRNKMYAILKHLLSPGRYYMFRVGAVNIHGSRDFSAPSEPFKLSKEAKAPSRPRNLSLGAMTADGSGLLNQLVLWLPPASDLPIVHYQVTWSLSDESAAEAAFSDMPRPPRHEKLQSSHAAGGSKLSDSNEFDIGGFESEIIPAEKSYVELRNLKPNTLYLIEVHAIVDSEAGELHGEKAVIFLDSNVTKLAGKESSTTSTSSRPTGSSSSSIAATTTTTMTTTTTTTTTTAETTPETQRRAAHLSDLQIQKPFVQNGLLKADMSWRVDRFQLLEDVLDFRFEIRWWPVACFGANSNPELLLSDPFQTDALSNSYELFDLQFACHYLVNVTVVVNGDRIGEAVQAAFDTPACEDARVDGETEPECPVVAPRVPSPVENLNCRVFGRGNLTAICTWEAPVQSDNDVTGYRVISGRKMAQLSDITDADAFPSLDRDTVSIRMVQARRRELHLTSLKADAEYIVQVQPISTIGVGDAVHRVFMASESDWIPAAIPDNPTLVYHTDDQAVANHNELPMERTSSSSVAISCKLAINSTLLLLLLLLVVNIRL